MSPVTKAPAIATIVTVEMMAVLDRPGIQGETVINPVIVMILRMGRGRERVESLAQMHMRECLNRNVGRRRIKLNRY